MSNERCRVLAVGITLLMGLPCVSRMHLLLSCLAPAAEAVDPTLDLNP